MCVDFNKTLIVIGIKERLGPIRMHRNQPVHERGATSRVHKPADSVGSEDHSEAQDADRPSWPVAHRRVRRGRR